MNNFSFSNSIHEDTQTPSSSHNMTDYNTWAEGIKSNYTKFGNPRNRKSGAWTSRIAPNNSKSVQFDRDEDRWLAKRGDSDGSETPSPTLWQNSPTRENLLHGGKLSNDGKFGNYDTSRAQQIAGYRKEMIDMVRGLPEAAYELSLRDIVEKRKEFEDLQPVKEKPDNKKDKKKKNMKRTPSVSKSKNLDTGLLIKLFLPLSIGKTKSFNGKNEGKQDVKGGKKIDNNKFRDEEWWRKNEFSDKGSSKGSSNSSSSSNNSNNSSGRGYNVSRSGSRKRTGCYSFIRPGKTRSRTSS